MPFYNLYLGYADDPKFNWEEGKRIGNIPKVILNFGSLALPEYMKARKLLETPEYSGRVLDWGASGARLTKEAAARFLSAFYPAGAALDKLILKLDTIDPGRLCVMFACEF